MADISHWSKLAQNAYGDNYNTKGYTVNDYMYGTKAAQGNHNWFGLPKANNLFSKGNIGNTMSYAATAASPVITNAISNGYSTNGIGEGISNVGNSIGTAVGGPWGAVISAGSGILGGLTNRFFGIKAMQANIDALRNSITNAYSAGNAMAGATDTNSFMAAASQASGSMGFRPGDLYKGGTFRKEAAERKGNAALDMAEAALAAQGAGMRIGASSIDKIMDTRAQVRYNALGGYLGNPFNPNNMGALGIMQQDAYVDAINNRSNAMYGRRNNGVYAFGGELGTNGADFTNGLLQINAGGLHETNPYQGVQMGVDEQGTPNLVEQGETVFNDYVFSNRMKVPETLHRHFGLGGKLKDGITFADASKKIAKESEERPNDPISIAGLNETLARLAEVQEAERQREQAEEVINGYALGGPKSSPTSKLGALRRMRENQEEIKRLNAGQEVFTPTPGRFGGGAFGSGAGGHFDLYPDYSDRTTFNEAFDAAYEDALSQGLRPEDYIFMYGEKPYTAEKTKNPLREVDNRLVGNSNRRSKLKKTDNYQHMTMGIPGSGIQFAQGGLMGNLYDGTGEYPNYISRGEGIPYRYLLRLASMAQDRNEELRDRIVGGTAEMMADTPPSTLLPELEVVADRVPTDAYSKIARRQARYSGRNVDRNVDGVSGEARTAYTMDLELPTQTVNGKQKSSSAKSGKGRTGRRAVDSSGNNYQYVEPTSLQNRMRAAQVRDNINNFRYVVAPEDTAGARTSWGANSAADYYSQSPVSRMLSSRNGIPANALEEAILDEYYGGELPEVAVTAPRIQKKNKSSNTTLNTDSSQPANSGNSAPVAKAYNNTASATSSTGRQRNKTTTTGNTGTSSSAVNDLLSALRAPDNSVFRNTPNPFNLETGTLPSELAMAGSTPVSLNPDTYLNGLMNERIGLDTSVTGTQGTIQSPIPRVSMEAREEVLRNQRPELSTPEPSVDLNQRITSPYRNTTGEDETERLPRYATWPRYAPPFFNGLMVATDALGLTNKGDYSSADKIEAAANALGYTPSIAPEPTGNYMKYIPMDITYGLNQLGAQSRATDRELENVAGTRGAAMAGIVANGNNAQTATGNLYRQALEYNDALQKQVEEFNSNIDKFNSQMSLEAAIANARYLQAGRQLRLAGLGQAASLREAIDQRLGAAKSANLSNFVNSLGNIGRENFAFNQVNSSAAANNGYGIDNRGDVLHALVEALQADSAAARMARRLKEKEEPEATSRALGGRLNRNKGRRR